MMRSNGNLTASPNRLSLGIVILMAACAASPLGAQVKPRISVLPLAAVDVPAEVTWSAVSGLEDALIKTKSYTVVSATNGDHTLRVQDPGMAACEDPACAAALGKLLSVQQVISGSVSRLAEKITINARIIDVETSRILGSASIDADKVENLGPACAQMIQTLVASAQSGPIPDTPETVESAAPPQKTRVPDYLPGALMSGGIIAMQAGNAFGAMGFEAARKSDVLYDMYMNATGNFDAVYTTYTEAQGTAAFMELSSYSLLGLGAAGVGAGTLIFPSATYQLSDLGRIVHSAGLAASSVAGILSLMAGNQYYTNGILYTDYMNAASDWDALWTQYQTGYAVYGAERIIGYSFWGLGGAAMACSFLMPGDKKPVAESIWNKLLYAGGMTLVSGGSFLQIMAVNARQASEEAYKSYLNASVGFDPLYADYAAAYGTYALYSGLSYGLLAGGAAAAILSIFVPIGGAGQADAGLPATISIVPLPDGIGVLINVTPRRS